MKRGHKNAHNDLAAEFVREIFDYNKITGLLTWKKTLSKRAVSGKTAGFTDDQQRIKVGISGKEYMAHRVIWLWMTGAWPEFEVDHRNQIKSDNRWKNLREATSSQNHRNRGAPKNNKSGYKGVCFDNRKKTWLATINIKKDGKKQHIHIGHFNNREEAAAAFRKAAVKIHGRKWVCV